MHPPAQRRWRPLFVVGCVAAVAATALPIVWRARQNAASDAQAVASSVPASAVPNDATSDILVDLRDDATATEISDFNTRFGLQLRANSIEARDDKLMRAAVPPGTDTTSLLTSLRQDSLVQAAELDSQFAAPEPPSLKTSAPVGEARTPTNTTAANAKWSGWKPNDPLLGQQWNFRMIGAGRAWERSHGKGVVVAVIDTGVAAKTTSRGKRARDFNKTSFVAGYDFVNDDDDAYDDQGHGTHVAGTIAESTNNKEGVAGLAFEATIMPVKVLSAAGYGTSADVADGIRFAADHGANIINMSLGSAFPSEVVEDAVKYAQGKGVLLVCAAGNGFSEGVGYPAAFPGCLAVSSVGPTGELAFYSSYGKQVALAAPGGDLFISDDGGVLQNTIWPTNDGGDGDGYYQFQGTSMACPHVAAVAALVMAQGVKDPSRVRDILLRSATPHGPRLQYGAGILSAEGATTITARQQWAGWLKELVWSGLAFPLLWHRRGKRSLQLSAFMVGAFWVGAFGPDWVAGYVGANSLLNLLAFSALVPFILFWELEDRKGSQVVTALSLGGALCLLGSLWGGVLSPFTATALGWTVLPWTLANLCAIFIIAGVAWSRSKAKS